MRDRFRLKNSLESAISSVGADPGAADKLVMLHELLITTASPRGFVGTADPQTLLDRHILQSVAIYPDAAEPLVDVGSGAGLPGLVLACLSRGRVALVEAHGRRAEFLRMAVSELALPHVEVVHARSEDASRTPMREGFMTGVARAVAPAAVTAELVLPLVQPGGRMVAIVGRTATEADAAFACGVLGGSPPEIHEREVPGAAEPIRVMIVEKVGVTPDRYPRRSGVPLKRPLLDG